MVNPLNPKPKLSLDPSTLNAKALSPFEPRPFTKTLEP